MAPARGAEPAGVDAGEADGLPRDHPGGDPARHGRTPRHRPPPGRRPGGPPPRSTASTATRSPPVLWQKVGAGPGRRVQSVATRLVVERERERMRFVSAELLGPRRRVRRARSAERRHSPPRWCSSTAAAWRPARTSTRRARSRGRRRRARRGRATALADGARRRRRSRCAASSASPTAAARRRRSSPRPSSRRPAASCACRRRMAMRSAQSLYEAGYITYMRPTRTTLSETALDRGPARDRRALRRRSTCPTRPAATPRRSRTPRRPTRPSAPPATRSARPRRWPARSTPTTPGSTS